MRRFTQRAVAEEDPVVQCAVAPEVEDERKLASYLLMAPSLPHRSTLKGFAKSERPQHKCGTPHRCTDA